MKTHSIHCILNHRDLTRYDHAGMTVLDFVRLSQKLTGTKEGCREGDCGACAILIGTLRDGTMRYKAINSCLLPLGDMNACHIVTVEGLRHTNVGVQHSTLLQHIMAEYGGTQCGFCTPGFIMSMTGYLLSTPTPDEDGMIAALDGNICRCTGYMSIRRAVENIIQTMNNFTPESNPIERCIRAKIVPAYFLEIPRRLSTLSVQDEQYTSPLLPGTKHGGQLSGRTMVTIAGGTDLYVQKGETLAHTPVFLFNSSRPAAEIRMESGMCTMDAHTTIAQIYSSEALFELYPAIRRALRFFASTPVRERATVAGNIANASPIGDMTALLLALNAQITLIDAKGVERTTYLKNFYKAYKTLDKKPDELISQISFALPEPGVTTVLSMEKVSRRAHLDIASVNSALTMVIQDTHILDVHVSAGGVAPIPLYLLQTSEYLRHKPIKSETFYEARKISMAEAQPISDARGSADYKRHLLGNLILAHALTLFPHLHFQEAGKER